MKRTIATAGLLLLAGCAQGKWYHPTANQAQFDQDRMACEYDAAKATAPIRSGFEAGWQKAELGAMCMKTKGYEYRRDKY